jgi:predicted DNA binding CopG/RHH family protein
MPKIDAYEQEVLDAFEKGKLKSIATKAELARLKAAARAAGLKDRRVNIRLSSGGLSDIQVKAMFAFPGMEHLLRVHTRRGLINLSMASGAEQYKVFISIRSTFGNTSWAIRMFCYNVGHFANIVTLRLSQHDS